MNVKKSRYLVTTADEATWLKGEPIVFLGNWCTLYSKASTLRNVDYELHAYHWKDRERLFKDHLYIQNCFERMFPIFAEKLNRYHSISRSDRYWKILAGSWLIYFISILYDRWISIREVEANFDLTGTLIYKRSAQDAVPFDMSEFYNFISSDVWNHCIYSDLIALDTQIPIVHLDGAVECSLNELRKKAIPQRSLKQALIAKYNSVVNRIYSKKGQFFLIGTYLSRFNLIRTYLRLRTLPQYHISEDVERKEFKLDRLDFKIDEPPSDRFEEILFKLIPIHMPITLLEGYDYLLTQIEKRPWPTVPKAIFTSNSLWFDTPTMAYTAHHVENGTVLIYGQHGGSIGVARFVAGEDREIGISDKYISWGWSNHMLQKVLPLGMLKIPSRRHVFNRNGKLLIVGLNTFSRYSYLLTSDSVIDFDQYIINSFLFVDRLSNNIRRQTKLRLTAREVGYDQEKRWRDRFPEMNIDAGAEKMVDLFLESRLVICTYNSTNFLEAVMSNTPTILFADFDESPVRLQAEVFFQALIDVGVVHRTPGSAADFVNEKWDTIESWWDSSAVKRAIEGFTNQFCKGSDSLVGDISDLIIRECAVFEKDAIGSIEKIQ